MASTMNLRYEGSVAEFRGCYVARWSYCSCARCFGRDTGRMAVTVEANGQPVRLGCVGRASLVEVAPDVRSVHERCAELRVLLGV